MFDSQASPIFRMIRYFKPRSNDIFLGQTADKDILWPDWRRINAVPNVLSPKDLSHLVLRPDMVDINCTTTM